jgi:hypothetical protein
MSIKQANFSEFNLTKPYEHIAKAYGTGSEVIAHAEKTGAKAKKESQFRNRRLGLLGAVATPTMVVAGLLGAGSHQGGSEAPATPAVHSVDAPAPVPANPGEHKVVITVQPGDTATAIFNEHQTPGDDREKDIAGIQAQGTGPGHMLMAGDKVTLPEDLTRP